MDYHCGVEKKGDKCLCVHILQLQSYRQQRCKLLFTCARLLEECTLLKVETLALAFLNKVSIHIIKSKCELLKRVDKRAFKIFSLM